MLLQTGRKNRRSHSQGIRSQVPPGQMHKYPASCRAVPASSHFLTPPPPFLQGLCWQDGTDDSSSGNRELAFWVEKVVPGHIGASQETLSLSSCS